MFSKTVLAHSGEAHETAVESTIHYIEIFTNPAYAIPLLFVALIGIYFLLIALHVRVSYIFFAMAVLLLVAGVLGFIFVPPLGVVAITVGFVLTGILVFAGIKGGA